MLHRCKEERVKQGSDIPESLLAKLLLYFNYCIIFALVQDKDDIMSIGLYWKWENELIVSSLARQVLFTNGVTRGWHPQRSGLRSLNGVAGSPYCTIYLTIIATTSKHCPTINLINQSSIPIGQEPIKQTGQTAEYKTTLEKNSSKLILQIRSTITHMHDKAVCRTTESGIIYLLLSELQHHLTPSSVISKLITLPHHRLTT